MICDDIEFSRNVKDVSYEHQGDLYCTHINVFDDEKLVNNGNQPKRIFLFGWSHIKRPEESIGTIFGIFFIYRIVHNI